METQLDLFAKKTRVAHFAKIGGSDRLSKLLDILSDGAEHTTLELALAIGSCAIHTDIFELRRNGVNVSRRYAGKNKNGRQLNFYRMEKQFKRLVAHNI